MQSFEKNGHAVIWGDALDVLSRSIPDASVDLIFADPPYNIGKNFKLGETRPMVVKEDTPQYRVRNDFKGKVD